MKLFLDFIPIILFFIAYKMQGIYAATIVAILTSLVLLIFTYVKTRKLDMLQLVTFLLILVLGGSTLLFHNENFIKYKPTAVYVVMALVFLLSEKFSGQSLLKRMMGHTIQLHDKSWRKLNHSWVGFFSTMAFMNTWVALHFDTDTWVHFKLFGTLCLTVVFILVQAFYIARLQHNEQH